MAHFTRCYLADERHQEDWRVSPLLHPDLSGLPPSLVLTAGHDPLHDEGAAYAARLATSGVETSHVCFEGQIHGFILMNRLLHEANTATRLCAGELRRVFSPGL